VGQGIVSLVEYNYIGPITLMKRNMTSEEAYQYLSYIAFGLSLVTLFAIHRNKYGTQIKKAWIIYALLCFAVGLFLD